MSHEAIRTIHTNTFTIDGDYPDCVAWDSAGNIIVLDHVKIKQEIDRLKNDYDSKEYQRLRAAEYPDFRDYLDGVVKDDQAQIQAYIDACLAVKVKYPKNT